MAHVFRRSSPPSDRPCSFPSPPQLPLLPSLSHDLSLSLMAFAGSAISSRHQAAASPPMELHHPPDPVPQGTIRPFQPSSDRQVPAPLPPEQPVLQSPASVVPCFCSSRSSLCVRRTSEETARVDRVCSTVPPGPPPPSSAKAQRASLVHHRPGPWAEVSSSPPVPLPCACWASLCFSPV